MSDSSEFLKFFTSQSIESGAETGFQFEITCGSCKKSSQTDFFPHPLPPGGLPKVTLFRKDVPVSESRILWEKAQAEALAKAADGIESKFQICGKCLKPVCNKCWLANRNKCMACVANEAAGAINSGLRQQAEELAGEREAKCPSCNTLVGVAKFCPKCGQKMTVKGICAQCNAKIPKDATFCTECGKKV